MWQNLSALAWNGGCTIFDSKWVGYVRYESESYFLQKFFLKFYPGTYARFDVHALILDFFKITIWKLCSLLVLFKLQICAIRFSAVHDKEFVIIFPSFCKSNKTRDLSTFWQAKLILKWRINNNRLDSAVEVAVFMVRRPLKDCAQSASRTALSVNKRTLALCRLIPITFHR